MQRDLFLNREHCSRDFRCWSDRVARRDRYIGRIWRGLCASPFASEQVAKKGATTSRSVFATDIRVCKIASRLRLFAVHLRPHDNDERRRVQRCCQVEAGAGGCCRTLLMHSEPSRRSAWRPSAGVRLPTFARFVSPERSDSQRPRILRRALATWRWTWVTVALWLTWRSRAHSRRLARVVLQSRYAGCHRHVCLRP